MRDLKNVEGNQWLAPRLPSLGAVLTSQTFARTVESEGSGLWKGGHGLQWGRNSGFGVPQTQGGIWPLPVTSCQVLVRLVASLSLRFLLCKMHTMTLLSQDSGQLNKDAQARAISLMINRCEFLHVLPGSRVPAQDKSLFLIKEGFLLAQRPMLPPENPCHQASLTLKPLPFPSSLP